MSQIHLVLPDKTIVALPAVENEFHKVETLRQKSVDSPTRGVEAETEVLACRPRRSARTGIL